MPIAPAIPVHVAATGSAPARTVPPPPPQPSVPRTTQTPPMGVILRAPAPVAADEPELINSDAAILIPPAVIVDEAPPPEPEKAVATPDQAAAFAASLEAHAREVRRTQSQVTQLPRRPKTEPPPLPKKTDAELKAERDAQVTEAISKVEPLPQPAEEGPRKKNLTTPQQWASASSAIAKLSTKPAEPTLAELQSRDRVIAVPKQKPGKRLVWLPIAIVLGAGGGYLVKTQFSGNRTASAAEQPPPPPPPPQQVAEVEKPVPPPADQPAPLPPEQPIEVTVTVPVGSAAAPPDLTSLAQGSAAHHHHTPAVIVAATGSGSAAGSADEPPDPRTHPNIAPASADCDEASCILEKYARECCARYKPAEMPAETVEKKPDGPPDTLDKNAVRAGIADVKPAVQQCGEDHSQKGTVKITLTVDAAGRVTDATVSETPDPGLGTCVAKALERASFAKTQNGAVFTYPFVF